MIAANRVGNGLGFEAEENALSVIDAEGVTELAQAPKAQLARRLICPHR